jgi:hypothetical protein
MSWTRRRLLVQSGKLALIAAPLGLGLGCRDSCVDPDYLSTSDVRLRASLDFTERSPHGSQKECAGCEFFRAVSGDADGCGTCQIIQGPVNPRGYCDSWSSRDA